MKEQGIIEYLKTNTAAYCLMPKECREFLEGKPFDWLAVSGKFLLPHDSVFKIAQRSINSTFRLRADYQPPTPAKWWYLPPNENREFDLARCSEQPTKVDEADWQETTAEFAAYLRTKPEGNCELREVGLGDRCYGVDGIWSVAKEHHDTVKYRWCKPRDFFMERDELKYKEGWNACLKEMLERLEGKGKAAI